ncbi:MAG TPA: hypothetical protein VFA77_09810 [Candidatus Eisenbacteria bacterium]|nr:hypothetical protein [Candidatus Eisenbacteria bacterium]
MISAPSKGNRILHVPRNILRAGLKGLMLNTGESYRTMNKRPLSVAVIGWLFIAAGTVGLVYHAREFKTGHLFDNEAVWVCTVRALAIFGGVCVLRGRNWARWLLILWMAYHVVLSAYHSVSELIMHTLLMVVIAYFLLRPKASVYFRASRREVSSRA